ncbi:hypothetical protein [Acidicapsa acidisoli]|nr:hypothetical protein [Acidicapsa acidisoli]
MTTVYSQPRVGGNGAKPTGQDLFSTHCGDVACKSRKTDGLRGMAH